MFGKLRKKVERLEDTRAYKDDYERLRAAYYELRGDFDALCRHLQVQMMVTPQHRKFISTALKEDTGD